MSHALSEEANEQENDTQSPKTILWFDPTLIYKLDEKHHLTLRCEEDPRHMRFVEFSIGEEADWDTVYYSVWGHVYFINPWDARFRGYVNGPIIPGLMDQLIAFENSQSQLAGKTMVPEEPERKVFLLTLQWRGAGNDWNWVIPGVLDMATFRTNVREIFAHLVLIAPLDLPVENINGLVHEVENKQIFMRRYNDGNDQRPLQQNMNLDGIDESQFIVFLRGTYHKCPNGSHFKGWLVRYLFMLYSLLSSNILALSIDEDKLLVALLNMLLFLGMSVGDCS